MDACPRADLLCPTPCFAAFWDGPIGLAFRADDSRQLAAPAERRAGRASDGSRPRRRRHFAKESRGFATDPRTLTPPDPMIVADRYTGAELVNRTTFMV